MKKRCVIVGGGHAGAQVATSLRKSGWQDDILLLSNEPSLPYHRPPLSKGFLLGNTSEQQLLIRPAAAYPKDQIQVHLNEAVRQIHPANNSLTLQDGSSVHYDKLVLCTGSRVRRLNVPGADLTGVFYIKTISDIQALSQFLQPQQKVVIIGGGYVGLESAAVLRKMQHSVTVLVREADLLSRVTSSTVSEFFTKLHQQHGVNIVTQKQVSDIIGQHQVQKVQCRDGSSYPADLVIVGIGAIANSGLAQQAGLSVTDGIVVDQYGQTSHNDIYAAGDCTIQKQNNGLAMRVESVPNALEQAKCVASTLCGKPKPMSATPWFWSDQYNCKMQMVGLKNGYDQTVLRQSDDQSFSLWYLKRGYIVAVDCINSATDFMSAKKIIATQTYIPVHFLADAQYSLTCYLAPPKANFSDA